MQHHFQRRSKCENIGRGYGVRLGYAEHVKTGAIETRPGSVTAMVTTLVKIDETGVKTKPETYSMISRCPAGLYIRWCCSSHKANRYDVDINPLFFGFYCLGADDEKIEHSTANPHAIAKVRLHLGLFFIWPLTSLIGKKTKAASGSLSWRSVVCRALTRGFWTGEE